MFSEMYIHFITFIKAFHQHNYHSDRHNIKIIKYFSKGFPTSSDHQISWEFRKNMIIVFLHLTEATTLRSFRVLTYSVFDSFLKILTSAMTFQEAILRRIKIYLKINLLLCKLTCHLREKKTQTNRRLGYPFRGIRQSFIFL